MDKKQRHTLALIDAKKRSAGTSPNMVVRPMETPFPVPGVPSSSSIQSSTIYLMVDEEAHEQHLPMWDEK